MILDIMLLCDALCNWDSKYTYKKTIRNLWVKSSLFPPQIECQLYNRDTNIEYTDQPKGEMEYPEDDILFLSEVVLMKLSSKKLPIIGLIKSLQNFRRVLTTY